MTAAAIGILCAALGQPVGTSLGADPALPADPLAGSKLAAALDAPLQGSWVNTELRVVVERIADSRRVAVIIDPRLDPNRLVTFEARGRTLRECLTELADTGDGAVATLGGTVVLAPRAAASRLRTLAQLRVEELAGPTTPGGGAADGDKGLTTKGVAGKAAGASAGKGSTVKGSVGNAAAKARALNLAERKAMRWARFDEPRRIIEQSASRWKLTIDGLDQVPYDLWPAGVLADVNAAEALTYLLQTCDLSFVWTADGAGVRIVPMPGRVELERRYTPRGQSPAEAARAWQAEISDLTAEADGRDVRVRGTVEQHEALVALLKPGAKTTATTRPGGAKPGQTPLARRTFTLKTKDAPAGAILAKLKEQGLDIRYDEAKLKAAGVDLEKNIALDLTKATARALFDALCQPIGAKFTIDGETVTITAR